MDENDTDAALGWTACEEIGHHFEEDAGSCSDCGAPRDED